LPGNRHARAIRFSNGVHTQKRRNKNSDLAKPLKRVLTVNFSYIAVEDEVLKKKSG